MKPKLWLKRLGWLGLGILPCPDCGAPIALHFWPLALVVLLTRVVRRQNPSQLPPVDNVTDSGNHDAVG